MSKGKYSIWVEVVENEVFGNLVEDTVVVANKDATVYASVVLTAVKSDKTIPLTIKYTRTITESGDVEVSYVPIDWLVIKNEYGEIFYKSSEALGSATEDEVTIQVSADDTYVVEVYAAGKFVGSQKVTVQGFAKTVTVALDDATRD